jgi:hypothetical protein
MSGWLVGFDGLDWFARRFYFFTRFAEIPRTTFTGLALFALRLALAALWFARVAVATGIARITRAVGQLSQGAAQRLDLAFVSEFLALGEFDQFQNFFHLIYRALERFDDLHDFINRLMNR